MRKVVFITGTLTVILTAFILWLAWPTPSLATPSAALQQGSLSTSANISDSKPASPDVTCDPVWSEVASPTTLDLHAVAAITAYDAWAVGDGGFFRWNGTSWNPVTVPLPPAFVSFGLRAVSARQANDIWAAGSYSDGSNMLLVVYHWDGAAWDLVDYGVDGPEGGEASTLEGITPIGAGLAIAVGRNEVTNAPTIFRCNSATDCTSQSHPLTQGSFMAVDAVSSTNVWAVGFTDTSSLIAHYDGTIWSQINTPSVGVLHSITIIAPSDIWAGGVGGTLHWNGTSWTQVGGFPNMAAISGLSTNDIWAVGYAPSANNIWHYNGTAWTGNFNTGGPLNGVSARTAADVWAVGDNGYITHYAAPQQFEDVQPGSTFYSFVQDLSCRAILSGYTCGGPGEPCNPPANLSYARPTANVTRGQLSKIIILAAGLPTPAQNQTFEDVPIGSTFHPYVEALAFQNAIGGYPCGGPGEPCGPTNKPYFRPNVTSTRGQTSKIVAITAGYTDPFQSQTFEDVPTNSTFYLWIENLASRSIINGYPCGGSGEPCIAPGNRPYFRTANNVTRGQMSKIAVITFTP